MEAKSDLDLLESEIRKEIKKIDEFDEFKFHPEMRTNYLFFQTGNRVAYEGVLEMIKKIRKQGK